MNGHPRPTPLRRAKPGRNAKQMRHAEQGPETLEEILEGLEKMLGDDRHTRMLALLRSRRHGDQSQPEWIRGRKSDGIVQLYAQLPGTTGDDLLNLVADLDETTAAAVLRRIEETFVRYAPSMTEEALLRFAPRYRHLTEAEAAALKSGKQGSLAQTIERHTAIAGWGTPPTQTHLSRLHRSPEGVREVYWTLVEDHLQGNPLKVLSGEYGTVPYEQLLELAESIETP